jgi:glutamate racemase
MMSRELPIGVFDSGMGGLTVVKQLHRVLPNENIVYLGDTARVPYGTKSPATVVRFACEDTQFLLDRQVKAVVVACNTCSAWALPMLRKRYDPPVFGVIEPGVRAGLERSRTRRIGVIGTSATIRSNEYSRGIVALCPTAKVFSMATPLLVPLVEEGWINRAATLAILRVYLKPLLRHKIDALILGCTHYPLLKRPIRKITGSRVQLVDSAESCAGHVRIRLAEMSLLVDRAEKGSIQAFVTDESERFTELARRFVGEHMIATQRVDISPL